MTDATNSSVFGNDGLQAELSSLAEAPEQYWDARSRLHWT